MGKVHNILSSLFLFCSLEWFSEEIETVNEEEQRTTAIVSAEHSILFIDKRTSKTLVEFQ